MVNAWSSENGLVLSQLGVEEKSNEITAIPEVLKTLDLKNKTVTIDAMGCQTEIAAQIQKQKGDYVLSLKKNHLGLYQRVEEAFKKEVYENFKSTKYDFFRETTEGRGRFEERNYFLIEEVGFLSRAKEWKGLSRVGMVESSVTRNGKNSFERRYYITSLKSGAEDLKKKRRRPL